eukprot:CAMPEP_0204249068 /NCGR_PEP_ID=MMETSP0361-20130328/99480_1 /ASSEMBLY_ACC=CAM_ASM_000343 /TAXON_ID=268821 /ORGANISM="Scrippsiella Hangoei, Strain SHTV-5" /LENGTH=444 /DNA_ID=CAMNT_0051222337 /DNA_START=84 /DNA_END=1419 /DNA_ORIENTATION=-
MRAPTATWVIAPIIGLHIRAVLAALADIACAPRRSRLHVCRHVVAVLGNRARLVVVAAAEDPVKGPKASRDLAALSHLLGCLLDQAVRAPTATWVIAPVIGLHIRAVLAALANIAGAPRQSVVHVCRHAVAILGDCARLVRAAAAEDPVKGPKASRGFAGLSHLLGCLLDQAVRAPTATWVIAPIIGLHIRAVLAALADIACAPRRSRLHVCRHVVAVLGNRARLVVVAAAEDPVKGPKASRGFAGLSHLLGCLLDQAVRAPTATWVIAPVIGLHIRAVLAALANIAGAPRQCRLHVCRHAVAILGDRARLVLVAAAEDPVKGPKASRGLAALSHLLGCLLDQAVRAPTATWVIAPIIGTHILAILAALANIAGAPGDVDFMSAGMPSQYLGTVRAWYLSPPPKIQPKGQKPAVALFESLSAATVFDARNCNSFKAQPAPSPNG